MGKADKMAQSNNISRSEFFSSFITKIKSSYSGVTKKIRVVGDVVFPPGATSTEDFLQTCNQCNKCVAACPHESIRVLHGEDTKYSGYPVIDSQIQPCFFCGDFPCIRSCNTGALTEQGHIKIGVAEIVIENCLAHTGKFCQSCINNCPLVGQAIYSDADGKPEIALEICNGCGICVQVCPAEPTGIIIKQREEHVCQ